MSHWRLDAHISRGIPCGSHFMIVITILNLRLWIDLFRGIGHTCKDISESRKGILRSVNRKSKVKVTKFKTKYSRFWTIAIVFHGHPSNFKDTRDRKSPIWAFPDCNSSVNSPMALKWWKKLDIVWKSCPIDFQGHPSNFKVTSGQKTPILTYRRGALLFFFRSSIKFQGNMGKKIDDLNPIWIKF